MTPFIHGFDKLQLNSIAKKSKDDSDVQLRPKLLLTEDKYQSSDFSGVVKQLDHAFRDDDVHSKLSFRGMTLT